jgi:hypothetical protein
VRAIYIRDVGAGPLRRRELDRLSQEAVALGTEMLLMAHAREALEHARARGFAAM